MKIFIVWLIVGVLVYAEQFALLVGIDHYESKGTPTTLVGAKNDVKVFNRLLQSSGVKKKNIIMLTDTNATKIKIQTALATLESKMKKGRGDRFYYFHAGHGARLNTAGLDISATAVLLPHDFDEKKVDSYLLTRRDLRPLFEKIDKKVEFGLLAFDSCYSGAAYRGVDVGDGKRYQSRYFEGNIAIDKSRMKLVHKSIIHPYKHLVSISASTEIETAKEDMILKRGVFSMALERCLQESRVTTEKGLPQCLDREYTIQKYVYKTPEVSTTKEILILDKVALKSTKVPLYTSVHNQSLHMLNDVATFTDNVSVAKLELQQEHKGYLIKVLPSGEVINRFSSLDEVKKFISNYRLIRLNTAGENGVNMRITYENSLYKKDNDKIPSDTNFSIEIDASKEGYLALFSLGSKGNLYMIYPVDTYSKLTGRTIVTANTTSRTGTEFLKVMIFDQPNSLARLKVSQNGEVLNDKKQIDDILYIANKHPFRGMTKKITTFKKED